MNPGRISRWSFLLSAVVVLNTSNAPAAENAVSASDSKTTLRDAEEWFDFAPEPDSFRSSAIDLRSLNETYAGEHGAIGVRGDEFIHTGNGEPVRFWGVNGPPSGLSGEALKACARRLAKYGVNLARMHGAMFDKVGNPDSNKVARAQQMVAALKAEGIYTHFSIYFPLWMSPTADHPWLKGYDGKKHPFAALMFNGQFQQHYREWWKALLLNPDAQGRRLVDEPAVFGLEIQNEDSFFFWTFNPQQIPKEQLEILETRFGKWLAARYGSIAAAIGRWNGQTLPQDQVEQGRVAFRPLWNIANERKPRDRDTAQFLFEVQQLFYRETVQFLRALGFKGVITASNWATASPEVLGPLEKWSYATGDFMDRHGYFSVTHKGDNSEWSIRAGHTYADRSALRFAATEQEKPRQFVHPAMDPTYAGKPSMISETTWNRPNRFRSEAPLYYAAYGALQGSDAIVHFAFDGDRWSVKPGYWMQPWTLMAPSQMAQFPATALLYRRGLVRAGDVLGRVLLGTNDLLNLQGTPLPQDANLDELRLKDVPSTNQRKPGDRVDPLIHYAGRVEVCFTNGNTRAELSDLRSLVDHAKQTVRSSNGDLQLDYGRGILTVNAPAAQGLSGDLKAAGPQALRDIVIDCPMDNAHVLVVSLDGQPLANSGRMLLQVMSEERSSGFMTEELGGGRKKILELGKDPWQVRVMKGMVTFKNGKSVQVQPLDLNGYPVGAAFGDLDGGVVRLLPGTIYYVATREGGKKVE